MSVGHTIIRNSFTERIYAIMSKKYNQLGNLHHSKAKNQCPSKKQRLRDHREAVDALHSSKNSAKRQLELYGETNRNECRTYRCKLCKGWHTTSQEQRSLPTTPNPKKAVSH